MGLQCLPPFSILHTCLSQLALLCYLLSLEYAPIASISRCIPSCWQVKSMLMFHLICVMPTQTPRTPSILLVCSLDEMLFPFWWEHVQVLQVGEAPMYCWRPKTQKCTKVNDSPSSGIHFYVRSPVPRQLSALPPPPPSQTALSLSSLPKECWTVWFPMCLHLLLLPLMMKNAHSHTLANVNTFLPRWLRWGRRMSLLILSSSRSISHTHY